MLRLFIEKNFGSKARKRKTKRKKESIKSMWKILTKYGIYYSDLKWICSSKETYYKNQDEYLENYRMR